MDESERQPVRTTRRVMFLAVGGILAVLLVMLVIVLLLGDPTDHLGDQRTQTAVFAGRL
ncbi:MULTISPECIES: hypothetical protein [unclassified Nocardioides]|uniref:hypothetical protein n=1 Tax=Nocardioides sp. URHA0032 TaxID=1380388 RepID=UPI000AF9E178|nr:hypothetical protein [Nocardioides sp. URHA0032]